MLQTFANNESILHWMRRLVCFGGSASSASVLHTIVRKELKQDLEEKYTGFFGTDVFTRLWNVVMIKGACCGVDSYMDFTSCKNWNMKETIGGVDVNLTTPISCCRDLPESFDVSCAQNADVHLNNIGNGCFDMYWQWTIGHTYFIVAVCAAIGIFQVIPGACSFGVLRLKDTAQVGVFDDIRQESHPPTAPPPSAPPFPSRPRMSPPLHQPRPSILPDDAVSERTERSSTSFETNDGNNESVPRHQMPNSNNNSYREHIGNVPRIERSRTSFDIRDVHNENIPRNQMPNSNNNSYREHIGNVPRIERSRTSFDIRDVHNENIPRRPHSTAADWIGDYDSERLSYAVDAIDNVHDLIRTRGLIAEVLDRAQALHETLQTSSNVITVSREEEAAIHHAFTCIICSGAVVRPMFASCCKTLIGCESCMARWYQMSPPKACPKCRHSEGKQLIKRMLGMDEAIQPLLRFVEPIGREV
ncbi:uncharacterized protein LOC127875355 isoform X5 [Dreissena polymorpha]|uniref:uncharacterized protein LOC127875355 isoform X2 n=1 Tax=Dreissena polymorpha TaxID=45954 RepID=UPI0022653011|nr:uncharacterized protein LOC127875355 isoform X2 [Dreissena polymorpha]XP_052276320.1 uncharacterized protein LOC127875355 isoform X3 [Dreissena polymorpha]XP_052276321.1 uncharacterized protein LOC127875355 isoform X4 [Dreissena polymorpha]XP_052276322.1 uncharacterized protein LOC127875355 isoform X5 [Dreissena polymorpha]